MAHTLSTFAASVREILQTQDNPAGREQVAALLRDALKDRAFVESLFDANSPERKVVYRTRNWASATWRTATRMPGAVRRTTTARPGRSTGRPTAIPSCRTGPCSSPRGTAAAPR